MLYQTNEKYVGGFKNDQYEGKGTYYYANGNIKYDGEFVNGLYKNYFVSIKFQYLKFF